MWTGRRAGRGTSMRPEVGTETPPAHVGLRRGRTNSEQTRITETTPSGNQAADPGGADTEERKPICAGLVCGLQVKSPLAAWGQACSHERSGLY